MIVSFKVPAVVLQAESRLRIALSLLYCDTPDETQLFETTLTDHEHVFITKNRPQMNADPQPLIPPDWPVASEGRHFLMNFNALGEMESITTALDTEDDAELLQRLRGESLEICQGADHPCTVDFLRAQPNPDKLVASLRFPFPVQKQLTRFEVNPLPEFVRVSAAVLSSQTPSLASFIMPSRLEEQVPTMLAGTHLALDLLPMLNPYTVETRRLVTSMAAMISPKGRQLQLPVHDDVNIPDHPRLNFKRTILSMFKVAAGMLGQGERLFGLSNAKGTHLIFYLSGIRLDCAGSIVLDAAVLPLARYVEVSSILNLYRCHNPRDIDEAELVIWKQILPALVERCRVWPHAASCKYKDQNARIPLSLEHDAEIICRCGKGRFPESFMPIFDWETAKPHCTRVAISPIYTIDFEEDSASETPDREKCVNCGVLEGSNGGGLRRCRQCASVKYCSTECQKAD